MMAGDCFPARGLKLNKLEIRRRIRCARTYTTEDEIRQALTDFRGWDALHRANFPPYEHTRYVTIGPQ